MYGEIGWRAAPESIVKVTAEGGAADGEALEEGLVGSEEPPAPPHPWIRRQREAKRNGQASFLIAGGTIPGPACPRATMRETPAMSHPCRRAIVAAALCLALAGLLAGCERPRARAAGAREEPAGDLLVYERGTGEARDLFLVPAGGGEPRRLTDDPAQDGLPRFSADGRAVIFTSRRSGNWQLWRVPLAGGTPARLRTNAHTEWQADESPNGHLLAFLSNHDGAEQLWLLDQAAGSLRALVRHGRRSILGNPDWSPDGTRIVFSSNWRHGHQIHVVTVATGDTRRISALGGCEPRFSPDGRRVVYVGRRPQKGRSEIVEHDLAAGTEKTLVSWPALNYDPVYSPDGSEIAFASTVGGGWEIYRQRLADGKAQRVTFAGEDARYPDYQPRPAHR